MAYTALYRKWRPEKFSDLIGQKHVSRTLAGAIKTGRIAHAYLFSGPRGTGKTSTAKILSRALNCIGGPTTEPCGVCDNCQKIASGTCLDVYEIDAASNRGIDEIKSLRETVKFAPAEGRYKVYIIDEVHMLTTEAFNALLKTLEEPPEQVVFILATTEANKVPATIQSRCQRYDFRRITASQIEYRLEQIAKASGITATHQALALIASAAGGGLRDALSILDQCLALADEELSPKVVRQVLGQVGSEKIDSLTLAISSKDTKKALELLSEMLNAGKELQQILIEFIWHLRNLMLYKATNSISDLTLYIEDENLIIREAELFDLDVLINIINLLHDCMKDLKWSLNPRLMVETCLIKVCRGADTRVSILPTETTPIENVTRVDESRLSMLERRVEELTARLKTNINLPPASAPKNVDISKNYKQAKIVDKNRVKLPAEVDKAGQDIWREYLVSLKNQDKMKQIYSILTNAVYAGMKDSDFFLRFKDTVSAQLIERFRYGEKYIIPHISERLGKAVSLVMVTSTGEFIRKKLINEKKSNTASKDINAAISFEDKNSSAINAVKFLEPDGIEPL